MPTVAWSFNSPLLGLSYSATLINSRYRYFRPRGETTCEPQNYDSCCYCGCAFGLAATTIDGEHQAPVGTPCADLYPTCEDHPIIGTYEGQDVHVFSIGFGCSATGGAVPGGCNGPPDGNGAEDSDRTSCGYVTNLFIGGCAGGFATQIGPCEDYGSSNVDCSSLTCRCPFGFSATFLGIGCIPGSPGGWSDPDATITVTGVEPTCGPEGAEYPCPCPDQYPCPDGSDPPCWIGNPPDFEPPGHCGDVPDAMPLVARPVAQIFKPTPSTPRLPARKPCNCGKRLDPNRIKALNAQRLKHERAKQLTGRHLSKG